MARARKSERRESLELRSALRKMCRKRRKGRPKPPWSEPKRAQIVTLWQKNESFRTIGAEAGVPRSTVHTIVQRYQKLGSVKNAPRQGRQHKATDRDIRHYGHLLMAGNVTTVRAALKLGAEIGLVQISYSTLCARLNNSEMHPYRPIKKPALTVDHKRARLAFAYKYRNWTVEQWQQVTSQTRHLSAVWGLMVDGSSG